MGGEVATMFVNTNLGTRICLSAPTDITVGELKKYFEKLHFTCLPDIGEIKATAIMVEEKPYFYHLPNSVVMNTVFPGMMGEPWLLHVEATRHDEDEHKTSCSSEEKRFERFHPCEHQLEQREATNDAAVKGKGNCHESSTQCEHQLKQCEATIDVAVKEKGNSHKNSTTCKQHEHTIDAAVKEKRNCHESSTQNAVSGTPERRSGSFGVKPNGTTSESEFLKPESKVENVVESHANSVQGSQSKMSSTQVISVTGLINKYFSGFNGITSSSDSDVTSRVVCSSEIEVQSNNRAQSCCSKRKIDAMPHSTPKASKRRVKSLPQLTPKTPVDMVSKTSGCKNTRFIVGERLLSASKSFRGCMTQRSPSLSVCRFNGDRDRSQINGSIFSISDSDN